jgi:hypothetical protein
LILLQQVTPPDPFANSVPVITSLVASANAVGPGETVAVKVTASDPDADSLSFAWSATAGSFSAPAAATSVWTAPSTTGAQNLTIKVTDGRGGERSLSLGIDVQTFHARGGAALDITFNTWPVINSVTAQPGRISVSQGTTLDVVSSDADGDALTYGWTDGGGACAGLFSNPAVKSPSWTAPAAAPPSGTCKLSVAVQDSRGGSNTGSIVLQVGAPNQANTAPVISSTFMSSGTVALGGQVTLRVNASDPESDALSFGWAATGGTLAAPQNTGSSSQVVWTAPSIGSPGTIFSITATVSDSVGNQSPYTFKVNATRLSA